MQTTQPLPSHRTFSLRVLLGAVAVVALFVHGVLLMVRNQRLEGDNRRLRDDLRRLRDEAGALTIEDESRLHIIRIATDNELEWSWRIWVPEGRSYLLRSVGGQVPKEGFPRTGGTITLSDAGEQLIRYRIRKNPRDGRWYGALSTTGASVGKDEQPWVEWSSRTATTRGIGTSTQDYAADNLVEIARQRVTQASSSDKMEDPAAGFLIWLEPK